MDLQHAIEMLAPYHNAIVICGQLSTGCPNMPTIPITDNMVCADDVYDAIIEHEASCKVAPIPHFNHSVSFNEFDLVG